MLFRPLIDTHGGYDLPGAASATAHCPPLRCIIHDLPRFSSQYNLFPNRLCRPTAVCRSPHQLSANEGFLPSFRQTNLTLRRRKRGSVPPASSPLAESWTMSSFSSGYRAFTPPLLPAKAGDLDLASENVVPAALQNFADQDDTPVMHRFVVTVETGDNKWAGTDQGVKVQLFGDRGHTDEIPLGDSQDVSTTLRYITPRTPDEKTSLFSPGSVREFSFMTVFVGNLVKLRVSHDGGDTFQCAWRLERVVVRDDQLQRSWSFSCQRWLNRDQGNMVELTPSGEVGAGRRASLRVSRRRSSRILRGVAEGVSPQASVLAICNKFASEGTPSSGSPSGNEGGVRRVCFQLTKYNDKQGHMYLFGAIPALGAWDTTRAHRMAMTTGADGSWRGEWRLELEIDDDFDVIEYKYMQVDETNDKVYFSENPLLLTLSEASDSSNRKVEGGVIYVRDTFGDASVQSPFCTPNGTPNGKRREGEGTAPAEEVQQEGNPQPTPPPVAKRNSLGFLGKGGSDFLVTEADSALMAEGSTPDSGAATSPPVKSDVMRILDDELLPVLDGDGTQDLKDELDVTRSLLEESKMEMMAKDAELQVLQDQLHTATISASLSNSMLTSTQNGERSSPVSSEFVPEDDGFVSGDSAVQKVDRESSIEDSKSETPEATDSEGADFEAAIVGETEAIPIVSVAPVLSSARVEERDSIASASPGSVRSATPTQTILTSPSTERRHAQRLLSAEKVRKAATKVQRDVREVRRDLEMLREAMAQQSSSHEALQADLVRLVMDSRESRIAEKNALVKEKDVLYANWEKEFNQRRKLFNTIQELKGNIRVFCRARPLKVAMNKDGSPAERCVSLRQDGTVEIDSKTFEFAHVFGPNATQAKVYAETSGVIGSVLDGYNVCVFAYGQTGSGKTHTMNGPENDRGVNFRALTDLFAIADERSDLGQVNVRVSMLEIYNEELKDLIFEPSKEHPKPPGLKIFKDTSSVSKNAVYVQNLTHVQVSCVEDVWKVMEKGSRNRAMQATSMNEHSSRSHLVLRVQVEIDNERSGSKLSGILSLVDLAGSERLSRSNATGDRKRETANINKSLSSLSKVFQTLLDGSSHVSYRDSKLTYLLQDSLGGDSKTLMFVNISVDKADTDETKCSLKFAQDVTQIELGPAKRHSKSTGPSKAAVAAELKQSKESLTSKVVENSNLMKTCTMLQAKLDAKGKKYSELEVSMGQMRADLKESKQAVMDMKKRDDSERQEMRQLRTEKSSRETEMTQLREYKRKAAEAAKQRRDEIQQLKLDIDERDRKIAALERSSANTGGMTTPSTQPLSRARAARPGVPRGKTVAGGAGARGRSVRFGPSPPKDDPPATEPATPAPAGADHTARRASARPGFAGMEARRAEGATDGGADPTAGRRATVTGLGETPPSSTFSNRRGSVRLGEPRRLSAAPPRAVTVTGSAASRFSRPTAASNGKRVTHAAGTEAGDAAASSARPARPPRGSTMAAMMRKTPVRNVGAAARAPAGGPRRANTFTGTARARAGRPGRQADGAAEAAEGSDV